MNPKLIKYFAIHKISNKFYVFVNGHLEAMYRKGSLEFNLFSDIFEKHQIDSVKIDLTNKK